MQINLHHCKAAADELLLSLTNSEVDIALVQEPYIYKNMVSRLRNANFDIFAASMGDKVRTCIVGKKSLNLIFLSNYSNGDMCTVRLEHKTGRATLLSSVYMPFEEMDPPATCVRKMLDEMTSTCNVILGCDANAHHFQWGSKDTNKRGDSVFDFILSYNLRICNRGSDPTFKVRDREEVIDLTLSNLDDSVIRNWRVSDECSFSDHLKIDLTLSNLDNSVIRNWRVSDECSFSDHLKILFEYSFDGDRQQPYRNPRRTNWEKFTELTNSQLTLNTNLGTAVEINGAVKNLTDVLLGCHKEYGPLTHPGKKSRPVWWNKEL
ncbi:uncharacterized protein LOC133331684, partial [Musca vetustissima]|uniref:uncharacterized protein LOC133331684 n=1 Tax=Musca vetustissima TaxID=27455 RepID=UPI002AB6F0F5